MDKKFINRMQESLKHMRAKVIAAKGEAVNGLPRLEEPKNTKAAKAPKTREVSA